MIANKLYMICLRNENKIYTVLYTGTVKLDENGKIQRKETERNI
jgi:hypothetical protein